MKGIVTKKAIIWSFMCCLLISLPWFLTCSTPTPQTPTTSQKQVVKILSFTDLTGPIAAMTGKLDSAIRDMITYYNVNKPIAGVDLQGTTVNHELDVAKAVVQYKKFIDDPEIMSMVVMGSPCLTAVKPMCDKDHFVAMIFYGSPSIIEPIGYTYSMLPLYTDRFGGWLDLVASDWKGSRPMRVCYLGIDNPMGKETVPVAQRICKDKGIELKVEIVPIVPSDTTATCLRIKDWGADYIYMNIMPATAIVVKDAHTVGIDSSKIVIAGAADGPDTIKLAGADACEGIWMAQSGCGYPSWDFPWNKEAEKVGQSMRPGDPLTTPHLNDWYSTGYHKALFMIEAVKRAASAVGPGNITRESIKKNGFDTMTDVKAWGIAPLDQGPYTKVGLDRGPDDRILVKYCTLTRVKNGVIEYVKPFYCPYLPK
jgi:ABC-type branched-subunit amino acid transport system substrate-binding protein